MLLIQIGSGCPRLTSLSVEGAKRLTDASLKAAVDLLQDLRSFDITRVIQAREAIGALGNRGARVQFVSAFACPLVSDIAAVKVEVGCCRFRDLTLWHRLLEAVETLSRLTSV